MFTSLFFIPQGPQRQKLELCHEQDRCSFSRLCILSLFDVSFPVGGEVTITETS